MPLKRPYGKDRPRNQGAGEPYFFSSSGVP